MSELDDDPIAGLPPFDDEAKALNVIIETPKGCANKYAYDPKKRLFVLKGILPLGSSFPFDFGFVPGTLGGDGDPVDVLLLMDEPAFTGCLVQARLVGVIEADQTENDITDRNDRLIAVATTSRTQAHVQSLNDLDPVVVDEIEHFFISYNAAKGKLFRPLGRYGNRKARQLLERAIKLFGNRT